MVNIARIYPRILCRSADQEKTASRQRLVGLSLLVADLQFLRALSRGEMSGWPFCSTHFNADLPVFRRLSEFDGYRRKLKISDLNQPDLTFFSELRMLRECVSFLEMVENIEKNV
jgi:hypothetical protein